MPIYKNPERAFWSKVDKSRGEEACWPWMGSKTRGGYGTVCFSGKPTVAHRAAYKFKNPDFDGLLLVLHKCDNPPCCNPKHLFPGTVLDNSRDRMQKGRHPNQRGERSGMAKLKEFEALYIRETKIEAEQLAKIFGISRSCVYSLRNGRTWKHLNSQI